MAMVHTWQVGVHHVFFCMQKATKAEIVHVCRTQLGRGHGPQSAWYATHARHPHSFVTTVVPVIMVRDPHMVTQLKLTYT